MASVADSVIMQRNRKNNKKKTRDKEIKKQVKQKKADARLHLDGSEHVAQRSEPYVNERQMWCGRMLRTKRTLLFWVQNKQGSKELMYNKRKKR